MDSKELRIGNFIRLKENGNIFDVQVVGTRCESIDVYNNGIYTSYLKNIDYYLEPIPLTEEWVIKFGFEIYKGVEDIHYSHNNFWDIDRRIGGNYFRCDHLELENIKHVHELQNLYYALTKKELTIK